jgi:non-specific serine/threonine protein kinase
VLLRDPAAAAQRRARELLDGAAAACTELGLPGLGEQVDVLRARGGGGAETAAVGDSTAPAPPRAGAAALRRIGDVWTITYQGHTIHLTDGRGVRLLALLLERPGREVHSLDLVAAVDGAAGAGGTVEHSGGQETSGSFGVQGGAGPALDGKAKAEYRRRLSALEEELAGAEARRDDAAAQRVRAEIAFVRRELSTAVGIGGRDRETGSHAERARINVTRAVRATIKRIAGYDEALGAELQHGVRTGTFCAYAPDPVRPLVWTVDAR